MIEILDAAAGDVGHAHAPLAAGLESALEVVDIPGDRMEPVAVARLEARQWRSEEHTSELQSLMRNSYAVFCLKKKNDKDHKTILSSIITVYYNKHMT